MIIRNLFVATWVFLISTVAFSQNTVVDIISNSEDHDTLEIAITAAGLDDDLAGTGPFTVFAPPMQLLLPFPPAFWMRCLPIRTVT
jgi:hypothetical protein